MSKVETASSSPGSSPAAVSHDKLFKTAFHLFLKNLLELVHPEIAELLDLEHAKLVGDDLFADFRKAGHVEPDLVAEAALRGSDPRYVLVHVETERRFRETIDERVLRYSMHVVLETGKDVVSVVVFLTGGPAGVKIREVVRKVGPFEYIRFSYIAFGLSGSLAEEYVDRPQPLAAALAALMRSKIWDRVEQKLRCLEAISRAKDLDLRESFVLARIVETYLELKGAEAERYAIELERETHKEVREMVVTWEEALAEREALGEAKGKAEGEAKGRAEGRVEATQTAILLLLKHRKGEVPAAIETKIRAIDQLDRLYEVLEQASEVQSLDELDLD